MPNTKSAERRMRSSLRKRGRNRAVKSRLKSLETSYRSLLAAGHKAEAATALRRLHSAFDKAAKTGAVHATTANRKKSRLAAHLNEAK